MLWWETLWPAMWPPFGVALVFLAVALFDVLPLLPGWLHGLVLLAFAGTFLGLLLRAIRQVRRHEPRDEAALRRVERDSGLSHHPLTALSDDLAAGQDDPVSRSLWEAHRRRALEAARSLRVGLPDPRMARRDPLGLRAAALLAVFVAVFGTWGSAMPRLERAVTPTIPFLAAEPGRLQVWITPPDYTGRPPILLEPLPEEQQARGEPAELAVPAGSRLLGMVEGGKGQARLDVLDGVKGDFTALGSGGTQRIEMVLEQGSRLRISQGRSILADWPVAVVQDVPPDIAFAGRPETGERGRLRVGYEASDDYGVTAAWLVVRRQDGRQEERNISVELNVPQGQAARGFRLSSWQDLTAHPWAGLPVTLHLVAEDALGQRGESEAQQITLPERQFTHPVARAIIEQRRLLSETPEARRQVAVRLDDISLMPESYGHDLRAYLSLRTARHRLQHQPGQAGIDGAMDLMWHAALRIEEGDLADAEAELERAVQALEEALDRDATAEELQRLVDQLQQATENYLQAMAEQMMRQGAEPMPAEQFAADQVLRPEDMQAMFDQLRDLSQTGAREGARQMLNDLAEMMQNLRMAQPQQMTEEMRQAMQAMEGLQDLSRRQQELMDEGYRRSREGGMAEEENLAGAARQEELRRELGEMMRQLGESMGEIPSSLGDAEQAMREATGSLESNRPGEASGFQGEALEHLREGAQQAMQALSRQMGPGLAQGQSMPGQGQDPLGRRMRQPGPTDDGTVRIPEEMEIRRSHEILDELRRRSGEPQRGPDEREYLHRLLRQF